MTCTLYNVSECMCAVFLVCVSITEKDHKLNGTSWNWKNFESRKIYNTCGKRKQKVVQKKKNKLQQKMKFAVDKIGKKKKKKIANTKQNDKQEKSYSDFCADTGKMWI